jgi:hypothetical protein
MVREPCFECGDPSEHDHHVVPVSRGGTKTVPLCVGCHAKAHHTDGWVGTGSLVRSVLQEKKLRKERTGTIPYGYHLAADGVHLEIDSAEQSNVTLIRSLYDRGTTSLKTISGVLLQRGIRNRVGNAFSLEAMRNILRDRRVIRPRAKLTDADVAELRRLVFTEGRARKEVAQKYGITLDHTNRLLACRHRANGYTSPTWGLSTKEKRVLAGKRGASTPEGKDRLAKGRAKLAELRAARTAPCADV